VSAIAPQIAIPFVSDNLPPDFQSVASCRTGTSSHGEGIVQYAVYLIGVDGIAAMISAPLKLCQATFFWNDNII
jgi:hypothetical protein